MSKTKTKQSQRIEPTVFFWPKWTKDSDKSIYDLWKLQSKDTLHITINKKEMCPNYIETMIATLKKGFPYSAFELLQSDLDVSVQQLSSSMNITMRTLNRRKKDGRFQSDESERIHRIRCIFERACDVLNGKESAKQWMNSQLVALGGKTPLQYCDTEIGTKEVENILGRIEHGVFS